MKDSGKNDRSSNRLLISLGAVVLVACAGNKPFQPPPPEYKNWMKEGYSENNIKEQLLRCGYKNIYSGFGKDYIPNEVALAERCMFQHEFMRVDGFMGICSLENRKYMPGCQGKKCDSQNEVGCVPDALNRPILKPAS